jgi:hypothetical protein
MNENGVEYDFINKIWDEEEEHEDDSFIDKLNATIINPKESRDFFTGKHGYEEYRLGYEILPMTAKLLDRHDKFYKIIVESLGKKMNENELKKMFPKNK